MLLTAAIVSCYYCCHRCVREGGRNKTLTSTWSHINTASKQHNTTCWFWMLLSSKCRGTVSWNTNSCISKIKWSHFGRPRHHQRLHQSTVLDNRCIALVSIIKYSFDVASDDDVVSQNDHFILEILNCLCFNSVPLHFELNNIQNQQVVLCCLLAVLMCDHVEVSVFVSPSLPHTAMASSSSWQWQQSAAWRQCSWQCCTEDGTIYVQGTAL